MCTSLLIPTVNDSNTINGYVYGRTMEFGVELESDILMIPRTCKLAATGPSSKTNLSWYSKYAVIGVNSFGMNVITDGMNEKGLVGGCLYFPGYASYMKPDFAKADNSLTPWDFLVWALTNFSTINEVKEHLKDIHIVDVIESHLKISPPVHYTLHDATGKSIVIEPMEVAGKVTLVIHDNPLGVLTNSPSFDWHITNLMNYRNITPTNSASVSLSGQQINITGQGSGLLGMPGDPTPASRFVRALILSQSVERKRSGEESVRLVEHILNNFDIPVGWIQDKSTANTKYDYTQWSVVADLTNLKYYIKTYTYPVLNCISFNDFDLDADKPITYSLKSSEIPNFISE